ncbi:hypothetical protein [Halorussus sp. MSC15.2]|uniref:hypothetical protein n=1 Tax=Halorussus sp. MSC15.2 TaxID=2283638 RepID=UPI0013D0646D|nr:hypothetical protein [Halorussus sp. MSC15.2]NEU57959.1 hypothetical protein [Halorussus sp. MSC15.2]
MATDEPNSDESDEFLHEELVPALLLVGVLLFLVPEPVTSTLGVVLAGFGVGLWAWDLLR